MRSNEGPRLRLLRALFFHASAILLLAAELPPAGARGITIASWGGAYERSQDQAYFQPFTAHSGRSVLSDPWGGDLTRIRAMVTTGNYTAHVLDAESSQVDAGCELGFLERIDYQALDLPRDAFVDGAAHDCGVGTIAWSTVFAYDARRFPDGGPRDWADFWDVETYPGKRGMHAHARANLEFALMADGVPTGDVYAVLATSSGRDRAFAKLQSLAPHVIWWEAGAQPLRLLEDREVSMSTAWNGRIHAAHRTGKTWVTVVWDGQLMDFDYWVIPAGHPQIGLAYEFIDFASRPDRQAAQSDLIVYGPVRREALGLVAASRVPHLPTAPANMRKRLVFDAGFWRLHGAALQRRFDRWLTRMSQGAPNGSSLAPGDQVQTR